MINHVLAVSKVYTTVFGYTGNKVLSQSLERTCLGIKDCTLFIYEKQNWEYIESFCLLQLTDFRNVFTGAESFEMALEHWYEAAEYVMAQKREIVSPGEDSFFNYEADEKLNALISGSRKLRKVIEHYNLMETPLPRTPSNMLTWIDDESLQEQLQLELSRDQDHENSSDTESFVSASDNAQLEVHDCTWTLYILIFIFL